MKDKEKWINAIHAALKLHQIALDTNKAYDQVVVDFIDEHLPHSFGCPFCDIALNDCSDCVWLYFTGMSCNNPNQLFCYRDDKESIERLNKWLNELRKKRDVK